MRTRFGHSNRGFTYLGLLFAVVLAGIALALTAQVARTVNQRAREAQLLFAGGQIRDAIRRYYEESPGALRNYPRRFEDLLSDPRFPNTRRHLRRLYPDPMTGRFDWVIERAADGGIAGVHSTSLDRPLKIAGFGAGVDFDGAKKYSEWIFVYQAPAGGGNTVPASAVQRAGR
jgi:type II secretory pathway pseudopilin PulG